MFRKEGKQLGDNPQCARDFRENDTAHTEPGSTPICRDCCRSADRRHVGSAGLRVPTFLPTAVTGNERLLRGMDRHCRRCRQRSAVGRVSRAPRELSAARNCTRDEGGPFEFGDQEPISSHRKLLRQKPWWCCVKKVRERHAVREMKEDPSEPSCRGRLQTAMSCFGQKLR